jgi:hypothetical protein
MSVKQAVPSQNTVLGYDDEPHLSEPTVLRHINEMANLQTQIAKLQHDLHACRIEAMQELINDGALDCLTINTAKVRRRYR